MKFMNELPIETKKWLSSLLFPRADAANDAERSCEDTALSSLARKLNARELGSDKAKLEAMHQAVVEAEAGYSAQNVKNPQQHAKKPLSHTERIIKFIASFVAWHALRVVFATEFRSAAEPEEVLLLLPQSIRNQSSSGICLKIPPLLLRKPSLRRRRS